MYEGDRSTPAHLSGISPKRTSLCAPRFAHLCLDFMLLTAVGFVLPKGQPEGPSSAPFWFGVILILLVIQQPDFNETMAFQRRIIESNSRIAALQRDNARRS